MINESGTISPTPKTKHTLSNYLFFFAFAVHLTTNMFAGEPKSSHWASTVSAVAVVLVAVVVAAIVAVAVIFILRNRA